MRLHQQSFRMINRPLMLSLLSLIGLLLVVPGSYAQVDDPVDSAIEDGFAADKLYQLGDVD